MIEAVPLGMPVPEVTRAANAAVQHAFAAQADVNTAPTAALPLGPQTEWQMASPIVGTVNLEKGRDITGAHCRTGSSTHPPAQRSRSGRT